MGNTEKPLEGPDFHAGVPFDDLREGAPLLGHALGEAIILVRLGDQAYAVGATCTHYGGPLAEGLVSGNTLRCPWHHACFDVRSGTVLGAPALGSLPCYEVTREVDLVRVVAKGSPDAITKTARRGDAKKQPASVVVIGAGPAAVGCVETLRTEGYGRPVTLIGDEEPGPVDRPNLSKDYLAGNAPEEWIPLRGPEFFREQRIDFRLGDPAKAIDVAARTVTLKSGATLEYGALLLAMGAEPIRLEIEGGNLGHVHVLRTLADSRAIIAASKTAKQVVVIGASFIGLEVAASLRQRGLDVTIVGPEAVPLGRVLGDEVGALVRHVHEGKGEKLELGRKPSKITKQAVILDDGRSLPADLVVMGVGVRPRVALAEAAGLRVDRGVVVDEHMQTSNEHVYAAGDVARFPHDGALVRIEHFSTAVRHGRTAALWMLGRTPQIHDVPFFWSAHHDVTLSYVGHAERFDRVVIAGSLDARDATVGYLEGERVRAILTVNRDRQSLLAEQAFAEGDQPGLKRLLSDGASAKPKP